MTMRIVLLTRASRPSGAQMAWRLHQAGFGPAAVIVEKRWRMASSQWHSPFSLFFRLGWRFVLERAWEAFRIRVRYFLRKHFTLKFKDPVYLSIEEWALDHPSVKIFEVEDHNGPQTKELLLRLESDVGVLTNTRRIEPTILSIPRHGFLNLHLSALPQYAGLDSIFWALAHGEKEIGVTVHFASPAIDRGEILIQRRLRVSPLDNENSLYQKALWLGTYLMVKALKQFGDGRPKSFVQPSDGASYFSWPTPAERKEGLKRFEVERRKWTAEARRPRIVHLITRMIRGGAQENTLATVKDLARQGGTVILMTGPSWGEEGEILSEALEEGLEVVILEDLVRELNPLKDLRVLRKLTRWFKEFRFDLIHTHTSKAGFLGRWAAHRAQIACVIHTPHGHVFGGYFPFWKEKLFLILEQWAARWTHALIALTDRCREEHLALGVGRPEQWVTIPSGVCERPFFEVPPPDPGGRSLLWSKMLLPLPPGSSCQELKGPVIGFIGRLARVKGPLDFVEALPEIFASFPEAHALIVGAGEERERLEMRLLELGIHPKVTWAGYRDDIPELLSLIDIVVVPSRNEGMGRIIVEAGFLSKPVVASAVGGIPDLIEHEKTGLLVPPRNPEALARAVIRLLNDRSCGIGLGQQLKRKVLAGFTETSMLGKLRWLYERTLRMEPLSAPKEECLLSQGGSSS